ncbi:lysophospholipid acyltransferase family protein [Methylovirgula sp. 4M-Z18]|uniref:lysophospholipid acyltransferase family protein n=1 Tax=Methylovirgula sp. 4M-Z18 TaxID=2293567 RepID=UPI000E2EA42D|nr:lysophospholipid acyltransferase family protein [Methylovirgula sp. 4M-Z18]RFB79269.1 1-acyl-sn-glycerol-3-phosphate acyltransferase [Methylovirgula sp. 4M-Z18]
MVYLRSALFNLAFYIVLVFLIIAGTPLLLMDYRYIFKLAHVWGRTSLWLLDKICGLKVEFRGVEKIPKGGFLIAPKHQSIWETFALLTHFDDFTFVLKRELTYIPFFGWYLPKARQIAIDRAKGGKALEQVTERAREVLAAGRAIFIFPEGTRRPPGAPPKYKFGVAQVYGETGARCLPVALNSGLFWPRRSFVRRPGKVLVEFLDPIEPGLDKQVFLAELQARIEAACNRLNQEAVQARPELRTVLVEGSRA